MSDQAIIDALARLLRLPDCAAGMNLGYLLSGSVPDRLALARALVADMPGVVVAAVPPKRETRVVEAMPGGFVQAITSTYDAGFNTAITAFISAGSATPPQPKEPNDAG